MIVLVDHYDSFVQTAARYLRELGEDTDVVRCDALDSAELRARNPRAVILSPGPRTPADTGVSVPFLRDSAGEVPVLGICLGHQCIVAAAGGDVDRSPTPTHGKASPVHHGGDELFRGIPSPFPAGRYHSLETPRAGLPDDVEVSAWTAEGEVMAVRHRRHPWWGVQFHPESILTRGGHRVLANFLELAREHARRRDTRLAMPVPMEEGP